MKAETVEISKEALVEIADLHEQLMEDVYMEPPTISPVTAYLLGRLFGVLASQGIKSKR